MGPLNFHKKFGPDHAPSGPAPGLQISLHKLHKSWGRALAGGWGQWAQILYGCLMDPYVSLIATALGSEYFHNKKVKKVCSSSDFITVAYYIKCRGRALAGGWGWWAQILPGCLVDPYASISQPAANSENFLKILTPLLVRYTSGRLMFMPSLVSLGWAASELEATLCFAPMCGVFLYTRLSAPDEVNNITIE